MNITNPPNAPAGYVAEWTGSEWKVVPITVGIVPARPTGIPEGYSCEWDGSEWVISPPPPPPSQASITRRAILRGMFLIMQFDGLVSGAMAGSITEESKQEVLSFLKQVANIVAIAQQKYAAGEEYAPTFPKEPTPVPNLKGEDPPNFLRFIEEQ